MDAHTVLGTCHHDCPDSCGWVATVEAGVAVKLRGNPEHPYSRGELCPKVNRYLDRVYSPDRVLTPLVRTGRKGVGRFERVSWDEALALREQPLPRDPRERSASCCGTVDDRGGAGLVGIDGARNPQPDALPSPPAPRARTSSQADCRRHR